MTSVANKKSCSAWRTRSRKILVDFMLATDDVFAITNVIANHEAFQLYLTVQSATAQLLSDALYDVDKFRWGPDNFNITIWEILSAKQYPLEKLVSHWEHGMDGIGRIKEMFRTDTGKLYGPDFLDKGLQIGTAIHEHLRSL